MSDNTQLPGTGDIIADEDIGGVKYQVMKIALGLHGVVDAILDSGIQKATLSIPVVQANDPTFETAFAVVAAGAGDCVEIIGSGSKVGRILEIFISEPSVAARFLLVKRSAAATGGTSANAALVPMDSADTASMTVKNYSAVPTSGAAVGTTFAKTLAVSQHLDKGYVEGQGKPPTLRGVAQTFCINVDRAVSFDCYIRFTESDS